jgi:uncharacterized protein YbjT (DUF2867 family)
MRARRKIAVAGATGRVGRYVAEVLTAQGHDVVAMSRSSGVDLVTGTGLAEALTGVEVVVDTATCPSPDQQQATEFFTTAAANLHAAGEKAGVRRMVEVSIIGTDRYTAGYNVAKVAHEQAMLAGPVPVRILRAAQFHELVEQFMAWGRQGQVVYVPRMRTQPIAARTVAQALADLALAPDPAPTPSAAGATFPEISGPREENLAELARLLAARRGDPVRIEEVDDPTDPDRQLEATGGLLPGRHATLAGPTFDQWLNTST